MKTQKQTITAKSMDLFIAIVKAMPNWGGTPPTYEMVTKEGRGNLTQLKKAGLVTTFISDGNEFIDLTPEGKAKAAELEAAMSAEPAPAPAPAPEPSPAPESTPEAAPESTPAPEPATKTPDEILFEAQFNFDLVVGGFASALNKLGAAETKEMRSEARKAFRTAMFNFKTALKAMRKARRAVQKAKRKSAPKAAKVPLPVNPDFILGFAEGAEITDAFEAEKVWLQWAGNMSASNRRRIEVIGHPAGKSEGRRYAANKAKIV